MICICELEPQWFWYSVSILCYKVPWTPLATQRQSLKSHHKDHGWPQVLSHSFLLISLELAAVPREQRGGQGEGRRRHSRGVLGLLDGINQSCLSASPSSSLNISLSIWCHPPLYCILPVSLLYSNPPYQVWDFLQTEAGPHFSWSSLQC